MPIYEEKLISPLAVRFTQERIRTTFRDERVVEESLAEIVARSPPPGVDDYDLVLSAPFPNIEIIRFHEPTWKAGKDTHSEGREDHWFTLDNRRLYCLQRAAIAHWPLRVAAAVDILYTDTGSVWKKYDTETQGKRVCVLHSIHLNIEVRQWDWREEIQEDSVCPPTGWEYADPRGNLQGPFTLQQMQLWNRAGYFRPNLRMRCSPDVPFVELSQLFPAGTSVPFETFGKELIPGSEAAVEAIVAEDKKPTVEALTTAPADPNSLMAQLQRGFIDPVATIVGVPYQQRCDPIATFAAAPVESDESDRGSSTADRYHYHRGVKGRQESSDASTAPSDNSGLAEIAIAEIEEQLSEPSCKGYIWLPKWNDVYYHKLGSLRRFLESHPDRFLVTPGVGKTYRVKISNSAAGSRKAECDYNDLVESAIDEIDEQLSDPSFKGIIRMTHWNDVYCHKLGSLRRFLESLPEQFTVTPGVGKTYKVKAVNSESDLHPHLAEDNYDAFVEEATREIEEQLNRSSFKGFIRIPKWNELYYHKLGSLRQFLESQPDKFKVMGGIGNTYTVEALNAGTDSCHEQSDEDVEAQPASKGKKWVAKAAVSA